MTKRKALGRGLEALLPAQTPASVSSSTLVEIAVEKIRPNSYQPRIQFPDEGLDALVASIQRDGILQPVVVRPDEGNFELIAGERRWRAAQKARLSSIPAIVQSVSDERMVELALVENIQREELNAIEEAAAFQLLIDEFHLTQNEVAERVSKSRAAVANTLRLLKLPKAIQAHILSGQINMGHARALLPLPKTAQLQLCRIIVRKGLSVREVERRVKKALAPDTAAAPRVLDPNIVEAERRLEDSLKTRVQIRPRGESGSIVLHYNTAEELDRLFAQLVED